MTRSGGVAGLQRDLAAFSVEVSDHVATVMLLGPGKHNSMGVAFWQELPVVFAAIDADPGVRAVVLAGHGPHFSVGLDLREMLSGRSELMGFGAKAGPRIGFKREIERLQAAVTSVAACRKPVIAAVSGWCIGGGVDLISAADVRVASADAVFSIREVRLAIVADVGSLQRLVGIVPEGHLRELALTGEDFGAERAASIGLVNHVYADSSALLEAAHALAARIAANSPLAVHGTKQVLNEEREHRISAGLRHVATWNAAFLPSDDFTEALAAFVQKRPAEFHGI